MNSRRMVSVYTMLSLAVTVVLLQVTVQSGTYAQEGQRILIISDDRGPEDGDYYFYQRTQTYLQGLGHEVTVLPEVPASISTEHYDQFWVMLYGPDTAGYHEPTDATNEKMRSFVEEGGRVALFVDHSSGGAWEEVVAAQTGINEFVNSVAQQSNFYIEPRPYNANNGQDWAVVNMDAAMATYPEGAADFAQQEYELFWTSYVDHTNLAGGHGVLKIKGTGPDWNPTGVYRGGDRVHYNGRMYEARYYTMGDNPAQSGQSGVWVDLGPYNGELSHVGRFVGIAFDDSNLYPQYRDGRVFVFTDLGNATAGLIEGNYPMLDFIVAFTGRIRGEVQVTPYDGSQLNLACWDGAIEITLSDPADSVRLESENAANQTLRISGGSTSFGTNLSYSESPSTDMIRVITFFSDQRRTVDTTVVNYQFPPITTAFEWHQAGLSGVVNFSNLTSSEWSGPTYSWYFDLPESSDSSNLPNPTHDYDVPSKHGNNAFAVRQWINYYENCYTEIDSVIHLKWFELIPSDPDPIRPGDTLVLRPLVQNSLSHFNYADYGALQNAVFVSGDNNNDQLIVTDSTILFVPGIDGDDQDRLVTIEGVFRDNEVFPTDRVTVEVLRAERTEILYAEVFSTTGFGVVDSMVVRYSEPLTEGTEPDSLELFWNSRQGEKRTVSGENIRIDNVDRSLAYVRFSDPFPAELTGLRGNDTLGTHFYKYPLAGETIRFQVRDRVGPLIAQGAAIGERNVPPRSTDTLYLSFTEEIDTASLTGETLILIKPDGENIPLDVQNVVKSETGNNLRLVIPYIGENAAVPGDSLRLNPSGTFTDILGNPVHPENRPVALAQRPRNVIKVEVLHLVEDRVLTTVTAGQQVRLRVEPFVAGQPYLKNLDSISVRLVTGNTLWDAQSSTPVFFETIPPLGHSENVYFTVVPEDGTERIEVADNWDRPNFFGETSVQVIPAQADSIAFVNPESNRAEGSVPGSIEPYSTYALRLSVYDRFGNRVTEPAEITVNSTNPQIGTIAGDNVKSSNSEGEVEFNARVTDGGRDDIFTINASLSNGADDEADLQITRDKDRLEIFYGDTAETHYNNRMDGLVGQRLPVTIRVIADFPDNPVSTQYDAEISLVSNDSLEFYQTESSEDPLSSVSLINGVAQVWVMGTGHVQNGTITVEPVDTDDILGNRKSEIYFERASTAVENAAVFADYGDGRVNRLEIKYQEALSEIPDSIHIYWPIREEGNRKSISGSENLRLHFSDSTRLTVIIPEPFPEGVTTFSGSNVLGTHFYYNPLTPDIEEEEFDFVVRDSVGPLIAQGMVRERIETGLEDVLFLSFSENLRQSNDNLAGNSLQLIKDDGDTSVLFVLSVIPPQHENGYFRLTVRSENENKVPVKGDWVRFNPSRNVSDVYGNRAHNLNRPVQLSLQPIPPAIDSALYYDSNADGIVDSVVIHFNKNVLIGDLDIDFDWVGRDFNAVDLSYLDSDSASVSMNLESVDTIFTSGRMITTVKVTGFDEPVQGTVRDRAAPVILNAKYQPGDILDDVRLDDTLMVTFSERLESQTIGHSTPFSFIPPQSSRGEYTLELENFRTEGTTYFFIVRGNSSDYPPQTGDSIYINTFAGITDDNGNVQSNSRNRRVPMEMGEVPVNLIVTAGPSPYRMGDAGYNRFEGITVVVRNINPIGNFNLNLFGTAAIYDRLGNLIFSGKLQKSEYDENEYIVQWDLKNRNGRYVSEGTYLVLVNIRDSDKGKSIQDERVKISVVR
ncbi:hypothetical protein CHISP_1730 [Chitinispirillum alkaliphilum]|nr:hypothetical protein CHISP_1730 [Chitinispirillum alkaliphilum]